MPEFDLSQIHDFLDLLILGAGLGGGVLAKVIYDRRKGRVGEIQSLWDENRKLREELEKVTERVAVLETQRAAWELSQKIAIATIKSNCPVWREIPCPRLIELGDPEAIAISAAKMKEKSG